MPVMKQLNVGGVTYDTVGEASVTQVVSTGTKIATVSIDGTSTDLYAPSGGSSVEPATDAPIVDGTAAVGSSVKYAREDHVHPTDTSRAAASHTHAIADVTSLQTTLDGKQATLVSGTNIKTVNSTSLLGSGDIAIDVPTASTTNPSMDGTASYGSGTSYARSNHVHPTDTSRAASTHDHGSITSAGAITSDTAAASGDKLVISDSSDSSKLKRSGIAFGSDTTTFLRNDGQWAAAGGGGGGVNKLILYTDSGETNLWIDQARTTTLFESYGYDYSAAKAALTDTDIIWIWDYYRCKRYLVVFWNIDTVDETFEIAAATGMGQVGGSGDFTRCREFNIYQ